MKYFFIRTCILCLCSQAWIGTISFVKGQSFDARLSFRADSLKIGVPVKLRLAVRLPDGDMFQVNDTEGDFRPFELITFTDLPPAVKEGYAIYLRDYTVQTFEVIPLQQVELAIKYIEGNDTTLYTVASDAIPLVQLVDSFTLKTGEYMRDKRIQKVQDDPNYIRWLLTVMAIVVLTGLLFLFLRKPLSKWYKRRQIRKEWEKVHLAFRQLERDVLPQSQYILALDTLWRSYLYPHQPYKLRSMSTTELKMDQEIFKDYSNYEHHILLSISDLKDQIIYADRLVATHRLNEVRHQLMIVLRKSYKLKLADVDS